MKSHAISRIVKGLVTLMVVALLGCKDEQPAVAVVIEPAEAVATNAPASTNTIVTNVFVAQTNVPPAKVTVPNTKISPALAEVVRLAQAGVGEEVLLAYVDNSPESFNLTSDDVVYLNDLGVPSSVITLLLQHNENFAARATGMLAGATNQPPVTNQVAAEPGPAASNIVSQLPPTAVPATAAQPGPTVVTAPANVIVSQAPEVQYVAPPTQVNYNYFYDSLAPYGSWYYENDFGWCWQPSVAAINVSWRPYCDNGRWLYTDCGWYWQSHYSWGWAPFHYGRWCRSPRVGWCWVPDTQWGPAWVTWRQTSEYCGWAPLPPACRYEPGFGLRFRGAHVGVSFDFGLDVDYYSFVPYHRFYDHSPGRYTLPSSHVRGIFRNSTINNTYIIGNNNTVINGGVSVDHLKRVTHSEIRRVGIRDLNSPDVAVVKPDRLDRDGRTLAVYRPQLPKPAAQPPAAILHRQEETRRAAAITTSHVTALPATRLPSVTGSNHAVPGATVGSARPIPQYKRIEPRANPAPSTSVPTQSLGLTQLPGASQPSRGNQPFDNSPRQPIAPASNTASPGPTVVTLPRSRPPQTSGATLNNRSEERAYVAPNSVPTAVRPQTPTIVSPRQESTYQAEANNAYRRETPASSGTSTYIPSARYSSPASQPAVIPSQPSYTPSQSTRSAPSQFSRPSYNPGSQPVTIPSQQPLSRPSYIPNNQPAVPSRTASPAVAPRSTPAPAANIPHSAPAVSRPTQQQPPARNNSSPASNPSNNNSRRER